ncbi:MAG: 50S ribosomal protein L22 [Firmicutes bacterium]|nr:50S ribosomal protein L22 [Candidatus Colimorpha enterica]
MEAIAKVNYVRISPRKVKIVLDLVRNKNVADAMAILRLTPNAATEYVSKLVKSAAANAENNFGMDPEKLYVSSCFVCPGPTLKRMRPRAHGRGDRELKRTSNITVIVSEKA